MSAAEVIQMVAIEQDPDAPALVSEGEYQAIYVAHKGLSVFRTAKLCIWMKLVEHPDIVLQRWYRVQDYRGGRVRAGRHSDLVRELSAVLDVRVPHDRLPITMLSDKIVRVSVATVTRDRSQTNLARVNQYSVISKLIESIRP
jgi:hypothetical protein